MIFYFANSGFSSLVSRLFFPINSILIDVVRILIAIGTKLMLGFLYTAIWPPGTENFKIILLVKQTLQLDTYAKL